mmetsp:Transcript_27725/g.76296  ORF Transcript_27725/g.76296 Transcript_27725/m.76296 type:complete len:450 (-) Transcript_27725:123-1472(-)
MPPVLDPHKSRVDGLAFLGLSLTRNGPRGHPDSATHQQAFDLDQVQDRDYEHIFSTNDDGWLVGGGEPGPPTSYKLSAKDSAHVEIMRIGTYREDWGGVPLGLLVDTLKRGEILIPEITVVPTGVVANADTPPELEIRFDMVPPTPNFDDINAPLPANWQLRFIQNQLYHKFKYPSRFTPGAFHSTILRKAEFRSPSARTAYFKKCQGAVDKWLDRGTKPLIPLNVDDSIQVVNCTRREPRSGDSEEDVQLDDDRDDDGMDSYYRSGLWLFLDRNNISHQFIPNFLPPYDTPLKKKLILEVLKEEWNESSLMWKSLTKKYDSIPRSLSPRVSQLTRTSAVEPKEDPAVEAKEDRTVKPISEAETTTTAGIFDPKDEDGFAYFVTNLGKEVSHMATALCAEPEDRLEDSVRNEMVEEEKSNKERQELLQLMKKPKAAVTGQRVNHTAPDP